MRAQRLLKLFGKFYKSFENPSNGSKDFRLFKILSEKYVFLNAFFSF